MTDTTRRTSSGGSGSGSSGGSSGGGSSGGEHGGGEHGGGTSMSISEDGVAASHGGVGVSVSGHGIDVEREFEIWEGERSFPTPVPGVNFAVTGEIGGAVSGGIGREDGRTEATIGASVTGHLGLGLSGGIANVAEVYLTAGPTVRGSATATFDSQGLKSVEARVDVSASSEIGVNVGGGAFDLSYELGSIDICSFIGMRYERGRGTTWGTFEWSGAMRRAFEWVRSALQRARDLGGAAVNTVRNAYNGARDFAASSASAAYNALTSW